MPGEAHRGALLAAVRGKTRSVGPDFGHKEPYGDSERTLIEPKLPERPGYDGARLFPFEEWWETGTTRIGTGSGSVLK